MKKLLYVTLCVSLIGCKGPRGEVSESPETRPYIEDWESLANHEASPEWFRNAKLGIYFHWGVYSVPAYSSEWYPRHMHLEEHDVFKHHLETYGHPSVFGYHDFVPMFRAENFDAAAWAELFKQAGARFAGPVAEHHDGFAMWDSEATPWNAADRGPKKDITGLLAAELKKRDIRLITTFHHAKQLQRHDSIATEGHEPYAWSHYPYSLDMPTSSEDPALRLLYGNMPEEQWLEEIWFAKLKEVIDQYQPDIIWFDYMLDKIPEEYRQKFAAYYLNEAADWGKEVVIVRKQEDLPLDFSVEDLEKSRKNRLESDPWMTDETISKGSWCYTENLEIKNAADVLHVLIDVASKNGVLLLNVSPKADGTIPGNQREVLMAIGSWLGKYGEAIYDTRPWYTYGEGPTIQPEGHFDFHREFLKIKYSWKDIRYTTRDTFIYATLMGWPEKGVELDLEAFAADNLPGELDIASVSLMGSDEKVLWSLNDSGLHLKVPDRVPDEMAVVFKIEIR
jgi:alpha-L-fucosidase